MFIDFNNTLYDISSINPNNSNIMLAFHFSSNNFVLITEDFVIVCDD